MEDLLQHACRLSNPMHIPKGLRQVDTPLEWREWDRGLALHPDQQFRAYIVSGIREGSQIGFDYSHSCRSSSRNMLSAMEKPQIVSEYLAEECAEGRVLGPFARSELPQVHTSCFGVILKGTTGKWWLIVDMSSPEGASANNAIRELLCSLSYISVRDAAKGIVANGWGGAAGESGR